MNAIKVQLSQGAEIARIATGSLQMMGRRRCAGILTDFLKDVASRQRPFQRNQRAILKYIALMPNRNPHPVPKKNCV